MVKEGGRGQSRWWKDICNLEKEDSGFRRGWFSAGVKKEMENGSSMFLWSDAWVEFVSLQLRFERLFSISLDKEKLVSSL